jgi:hypothetical protein
MAAGLGALHEVIDGLVELDVDALDDADLHAVAMRLQRERARLGALAAQLLRRWDERRVWASDGSRSASARLGRESGCSAVTAGVELRRARQAGPMPVAAAALGRGELSLDHLDLLGRANQPHRARDFSRDEPTLVAECARLRFRQAQRMVAYWCQRVDAEAGHDGTAPPEDGTLHVSATLSGAVAINGLLDPIGGAIVRTELRRLERQLVQADERDGRQRSRAQRRAAALVLMAERSATAPVAGRPPKPLFTVLLGDSSFAQLCELANGTVVSPKQLGPWLGTAELEAILFEGPSTVISVSKRRTFTGALRRAIEVRDRHCQHPSGCDIAAEDCDVDHIVPRSRRGPTSQFNGRLECTTHNRRPDHHDHDAQPRPHREITRLDELRARIRWRVLRDLDDEDDDDEGDLGDERAAAAG